MSSLTVHRRFPQDDRAGRKFVQQIDEFCAGGNLHGIHSLAEASSSPIDESCGTFKNDEAETARAQINGEDSLVLVHVTHGV